MANLVETWKILSEDIDGRSRGLAAGVAEAWNHVQSLSRMLDQRLREQDPLSVAPGGTESLQTLFQGLAERLLFEPLALYRKKRPLLSVLSAIRDYEAGLDSAVERLPLTYCVSGRELAMLPGAEGVRNWRRQWLRWRNRARDIPLRGIVSGHLQRDILCRGAIDGAIQLLLTRSCLHLLGPWQMHRQHALKLQSGVRSPGALEIERRRWAEEAEELARRMAPLLDACGKWAGSATRRLTAAVSGSLSEPSRRTRTLRSERQQRRLHYWERQQRAVQAILETEGALAALAADMTGEIARTLESIQLEHDQLLRELEDSIDWLEAWSAGAGEFPSPQVTLIPAEERAKDWERRVLDRSRARLPVSIEVIAPRGALPGRGSPWRDLQPGKIFSGVVAASGTPRLLAAFCDAAAGPRLLLREIEHAREVVAFAEETARVEGENGQAAAREAVRNVRSLLLYRRKMAPEVRPASEAALVRTTAIVLLECHAALEIGRLGLFAHLTRQRGLQAVKRARDLLLAGLRTSTRRAWLTARRVSEQALIRIGWLPPPRPRLDPVGRRAHLGQVLDLRLRDRDLPMIYRRLFRLTPVEDPRFLVGREAEMAGLAEAFARWNSGLRGSAVVVGARGSGKTSLLNSAVAGIFGGLPTVRGQLSARVTTVEQMHGLLRNLVQLPEDSDVARALAERRRVLIIEELERSFLRVINGFEGLRELLTLIYRTSDTTLWIFSINETAFRYLDAVVGLGRHFSHRINAMSVTREDLIGAIRQRHDLTGLRLEFAPLPPEDPRVSRIRRLLGLEQDPEQLFFDSLHRQSEGIFRSAFQLWQGSIERVEDGVVHMRQPLVPNYGPLLSELVQEDLFALQAILQHGGLTAEEVARVSRRAVHDSERCLERLRLLEILEPEPDCLGLRVRPEAGLFVREALHRHNLW